MPSLKKFNFHIFLSSYQYLLTQNKLEENQQQPQQFEQKTTLNIEPTSRQSERQHGDIGLARMILPIQQANQIPQDQGIIKRTQEQLKISNSKSAERSESKSKQPTAKDQIEIIQKQKDDSQTQINKSKLEINARQGLFQQKKIVTQEEKNLENQSSSHKVRKENDLSIIKVQVPETNQKPQSTIITQVPHQSVTNHILPTNEPPANAQKQSNAITLSTKQPVKSLLKTFVPDQKATPVNQTSQVQPNFKSNASETNIRPPSSRLIIEEPNQPKPSNKETPIKDTQNNSKIESKPINKPSQQVDAQAPKPANEIKILTKVQENNQQQKIIVATNQIQQNPQQISQPQPILEKTREALKQTQDQTQANPKEVQQTQKSITSNIPLNKESSKPEEIKLPKKTSNNLETQSHLKVTQTQQQTPLKVQEPQQLNNIEVQQIKEEGEIQQVKPLPLEKKNQEAKSPQHNVEIPKVNISEEKIQTQPQTVTFEVLQQKEVLTQKVNDMTKESNLNEQTLIEDNMSKMQIEEQIDQQQQIPQTREPVLEICLQQTTLNQDKDLTDNQEDQEMKIFKRKSPKLKIQDLLNFKQHKNSNLKNQVKLVQKFIKQVEKQGSQILAEEKESVQKSLKQRISEIVFFYENLK